MLNKPLNTIFAALQSLFLNTKRKYGLTAAFANFPKSPKQLQRPHLNGIPHILSNLSDNTYGKIAIELLNPLIIP